jgi:putative membrane protein
MLSIRIYKKVKEKKSWDKAEKEILEQVDKNDKLEE